jgi:hypothetical protein
MRKTLIFGVAMALSLALTNTLHAGPWPPKNLCFNWAGARDIAFVLKMVGTLKTSNGVVKMYSINGVHDPGGGTETPIVGTGYLGTDGNFHFSYYGQELVELSGSSDFLLTAKGTINPTTIPATGTLTFDWVNTASATYSQINWPGAVTVINCATDIIKPLSSVNVVIPGGTDQ